MKLIPLLCITVMMLCWIYGVAWLIINGFNILVLAFLIVSLIGIVVFSYITVNESV
jgi:hypothetical protein